MRILIAVIIIFVGALANAKVIEVKMLNSGKEGPMVFEPGYVLAAPGDTLKFVPTDQAHNSQSVSVPAGARSWKGKMNESITVKLDKEGVYVYSCEPHAVMAMVGVVQVGKPTNLEAVKKETQALSAKFVMSKDRLKKYLDQVK